MICQINGALTFFLYYFNVFFYVREDNYSNVYVMIKRLIWTPMSSVLKKADKLNLSLSLLFLVNNILAGLWLNCIFSSDEITLSSGWDIIAA